MTKLTVITSISLLCVSMAQSAELTINPAGPVGPVTTLTGKAPAANAKIFVIVNPVETPYQFWVQKMVEADGKKNWTCASVHVGEPGKANLGQKFLVFAVVDPNEAIHEGDVLSELPQSRWISQPLTLVRK